MTAEQWLADLEAKAKAATPGPWEIGVCLDRGMIRQRDGSILAYCRLTTDDDIHNAAFISSAIRVERVQDISEEDVQAEGFSDRPASKNKFRIAWDLLYWKRGLGWSVNPRVWVITFKRVENRNE